MYNIGDFVVYGLNGVCVISGIEENDSGQFYRLEPVNDSSLKIILPVNTDRIRRPVEREEIARIMNGLASADLTWDNDNRERRRRITEITTECAPDKLIVLMKIIFDKKAERRKSGKMMFSFEDGVYKNIEKAIVGEFAYVMKIPASDARNMLMTRLAK